MNLKISHVAVMLMILYLIANGTVIGSDEIRSGRMNGSIQQSSRLPKETTVLSHLAFAFSSGREALRSFHGFRSEINSHKARLNPPVPEMDCYIDRIAIYVSCFSSLSDILKAETLFDRLLDELRDALPSDRWSGTTKQPGTPSVRSFTYADRKTNAHIDIDIVDKTGSGEQISYIVTIFGWTY